MPVDYRDPRLVLVPHRSPHHAMHSGYALLSQYLPGTIVTKEDNAGSWMPWQLRKSIASFAGAGRMYGEMSFRREMRVLQQMFSHPKGVVHFFHGERDFYYTGMGAKFRKWHTSASFHKPPDGLHDYLQGSQTLKRLDVAFAVGSNQIPTLNEMMGGERAMFIPHGIDIDFFTPTDDDSEWDEHTCLFVGSHLRDIEMLGRTAAILKEDYPDITINVVTSAKEFKKLVDYPYINHLSGISDEELLNQYRNATCLLLPLIDSTACNSFLESIACGLPVVTNDIGGVCDYLDETCAFICENGSPEALADAVKRLIEDRELNRTMRRAARVQSEQFSWIAVRDMILGVYKDMFDFDPQT